MAHDTATIIETDTINALIGSAAQLHELRATRPEVARYAQGSYNALLEPADPAGLSLIERHLVAARVATISADADLAAHYRRRLTELGADAALIAAADPHTAAEDLTPRTVALLRHADALTRSPHTTGRAALEALGMAGFSTPDRVTLAQLITFVTFQVRLLAGLRVLGGLTTEAPAPDLPELIDHRGFTLDAVDWESYLDTVDPAQATAEQLAVLDESSPSGRTSQYYTLLVHDVHALRERSRLFKAVMYGPGGLPRADRELASVAVSKVNGCIYCASVHSRLYAQLTKRPEVMQRIFDEGVNTTLEPRERAIVDYAVALTRDPSGRTANLSALRNVGLSDRDMLDVTHAIAMFAWANRLLQSLGAVVRTPAA